MTRHVTTQKRLAVVVAALAAFAASLWMWNWNASGASARTSSQDLEAGLYQEFVGSNGRVLEFHYFDNGNRGTLFYFDGDGTTNFHYPTVAADVHHEPGVGNGHVQRMNEVAKNHGMDLVFIEHPDGKNGGRSWWAGMTDEVVNEYALAVQELIVATDSKAVQLVGYSGGSEFLVRHLLLNGNDWLPKRSAATMIGGGGLAGYPLVDPSPRMQDMPYRWVVGEQDVEGAAKPETWSALRVSKGAVEVFEEKGYRAAELVVIPNTNHINYNFKGIVDGELDSLVGDDCKQHPHKSKPHPHKNTCANTRN